MVRPGQFSGPAPATPAVPVDLEGAGAFGPVAPDALRDDGLADAVIG
jgi:hypothetical protein